MLIPDLAVISTLLEDTNFDGTFETGWATADYHLAPFNANPTAEAVHKPYTVIYVRDTSDGTQDAFLRGQRNYRIVGTWGYGAVTKDSGRTPSASWDATATALDVNGTSGIEMGWTILIDSEQMYVSSKGSGTGTSITVRRGVNGSTGATHAATAAINYYVYPAPVAEAVLMQVSRLVKRAQAGFVSQLGIPETGQIEIMEPPSRLDADIRVMLVPYRRIGI